MPRAKKVVTPNEKPLVEPADSRPDSTANLPKVKPLGANTYSDKTLAKQFSDTLINKGNLVRNTMANTAIVLAMRAQKASQSYSKKDFNALYRLVLSASIAMDKAFPQQVQPLGNATIVNLFSGLGADAVRTILQPVLPKVEVVVDTPTVETPTNEQETPNDDPLDETT